MTTPNPPAGHGGDEHDPEANGAGTERDDQSGDVTQPVSQPESPYSVVGEGSGGEPKQDPWLPNYPPPAPDQQATAASPQPGYGQQPPAYGQQPPAYGQQPPAYGQQPPAYGQQPPAYGQQPPAYGQQPPAYGPQPGYGQPQYGAAQPWETGAYGMSPMNVLPKEAYASWGQRVVAYLIDFAGFWIAWTVGYVIAGIGIARTDSSTSGDVDPLTVIGYLLVAVTFLAYVIFSIWNRWIRTGRTGMSLGKEKMGIKLVSEDTGQPIGAGMAFVRDLAHYVDGLICSVGYLFPLWDDKRQTLADKIVKTVVVKTR